MIYFEKSEKLVGIVLAMALFVFLQNVVKEYYQKVV